MPNRTEAAKRKLRQPGYRDTEVPANDSFPVADLMHANGFRLRHGIFPLPLLIFRPHLMLSPFPFFLANFVFHLVM